MTAIKAGQGHPLEGGVGGTCQGGFELPLCGGQVFPFFGEFATKGMSAGGIYCVQLLCDSFGFIHTAADCAGGLLIELAQIGEGIGVAWVEFDGCFKLFPGVPGQTKGAHEGSAACSFA